MPLEVVRSQKRKGEIAEMLVLEVQVKALEFQSSHFSKIWCVYVRIRCKPRIGWRKRIFKQTTTSNDYLPFYNNKEEKFEHQVHENHVNSLTKRNDKHLNTLEKVSFNSENSEDKD